MILYFRCLQQYFCGQPSQLGEMVHFMELRGLPGKMIVSVAQEFGQRRTGRVLPKQGAVIVHLVLPDHAAARNICRSVTQLPSFIFSVSSIARASRFSAVWWLLTKGLSISHT